MERTLELTLTISENGMYFVFVHDQESDLNVTYMFEPFCDTNNDFNKAIGDEVSSWFSIMQEEMEYTEIEEK